MIKLKIYTPNMCRNKCQEQTFCKSANMRASKFKLYFEMSGEKSQHQQQHQSDLLGCLLFLFQVPQSDHSVL